MIFGLDSSICFLMEGFFGKKEYAAMAAMMLSKKPTPTREVVPHVDTDVVLIEMFEITVLATVKTDQQGDHLRITKASSPVAFLVGRVGESMVCKPVLKKAQKSSTFTKVSIILEWKRGVAVVDVFV
jgi:hypothetical protein